MSQPIKKLVLYALILVPTTVSSQKVQVDFSYSNLLTFSKSYEPFYRGTYNSGLGKASEFGTGTNLSVFPFENQKREFLSNLGFRIGYNRFNRSFEFNNNISSFNSNGELNTSTYNSNSNANDYLASIGVAFKQEFKRIRFQLTLDYYQHHSPSYEIRSSNEHLNVNLKSGSRYDTRHNTITTRAYGVVLSPAASIRIYDGLWLGMEFPFGFFKQRLTGAVKSMFSRTNYQNGQVSSYDESHSETPYDFAHITNNEFFALIKLGYELDFGRFRTQDE